MDNVDIDEVFILYHKFFEEKDKADIRALTLQGVDVKKIPEYHKYLFERKEEDVEKFKTEKSMYENVAKRLRHGR